MKQSAGLLLYTQDVAGLAVLLVHASGGYNRKAPYGIPKGEPNPNEPLEDAARRETLEETGVVVTTPVVALGFIDYKRSRKRIHAFAAPLPAGVVPKCASWEIDKAEILPMDRARAMIHPDQCAFLERLLALL